MTTAQVAQGEWFFPKTVRSDVANILAKLQVADRVEAIIRAKEAGIGP